LESFDTLIIGFNNTTRGEVQSALDSDLYFKADPLKMPWEYYELTRANELPLCLLIPLTRSVTHAGCLHLYQLIEPEFGSPLAPFFEKSAQLSGVMREGPFYSTFHWLGEPRSKLNPDFYFARAERAAR
jgi:hypothetical protein